MTTFISQCSICTHLNSLGETWKCLAYPNGIPREIIANEIAHIVPYGDQVNQTLFSPVNASTPPEEERLPQGFQTLSP